MPATAVSVATRQLTSSTSLRPSVYNKLVPFNFLDPVGTKILSLRVFILNLNYVH